MQCIGLIGYGEVGKIFSRGLRCLPELAEVVLAGKVRGRMAINVAR